MLDCAVPPMAAAPTLLQEAPLISESASRSPDRFIRLALLVLGAALIAYAISDHPLYGGRPGFGMLRVLIVSAGAALTLSALLSPRYGAPILLVSVSSLATLAVAEFVGEFALGPRYRPIFQPDERLIFKFIPNRVSVMTHAPVNGGKTVTHRINSAGFRGGELRPPGSAPRVVVYGDSFIHAFYTAQEKTFVARLAALLSEGQHTDIELVNAGVSSYGPDQISVKMEEELPILRPDLVIAAIFAGNDYGDLMRNKMFRLGAEGGLVPNAWRLDPRLRAQFEISQRESILLRALRGIRSPAPPVERHSAAPDLGFLLKEAEREYRSYIVDRDNVVVNTHIDYYSADVSLMPGSESALYKVALMRKVLERIRELASRNGVPLVFLFIPHPGDLTDADAGWRIDRVRFPRYDGRNQSTPLEDSARDLSVPFVSLYDVFRANRPPDLYYRGGNDHWNDAGQELAAKVMADFLRARGLPPRARQPSAGVADKGGRAR